MKTEAPTDTAPGAPTQARDVMTTRVITVGPDTPVRDVARLLLDNAISAVPVVDNDGVPVGMVSEGDLIGRGEEERVARRDWWLALVSGRQPPDADWQARLQARDRAARDIMSAPVVTVTEQTDLREIARLLAAHRIKRVPVLRDGRLVGIVSRADLVRALAAAPPPETTGGEKKHRGFLSNLISDYHLPARETARGIDPEAPPPKSDESRLAADDFRHLVEDFHSGEAQHREEARRAVAGQRRERAKQLIDAHVSDAAWRDMLHRAREAAEKGLTEYMLLRFPGELCVDGGRAINVPDPDWPATLRGEPAEIYLRWERELKPQGFGLSARVLEYPGGKPGDIGLFLVWGE
jgi:CBS domain-containing protein